MNQKIKTQKVHTTSVWQRLAQAAVIAASLVLFPRAWVLGADVLNKATGGYGPGGSLGTVLIWGLIETALFVLVGLGIFAFLTKRLSKWSWREVFTIMVLSLVFASLLARAITDASISTLLNLSYLLYGIAIVVMPAMNIVLQFCIWLVSIYGSILMVGVVKTRATKQA